MKRKISYVGFPLLVLLIVLTGCGGTPAVVPTETVTATETETAIPVAPATSTVSATPDPCAPGQIETEVEKVHKHMREFDDASVVASNVGREQLADAIARLQKIRREAEDEQVPSCLEALRKYQVDHMNSVINTLIAFMSGAEQQTVDQGISLARQQHDQYTVELARLLGLTVVPAESTATPTP
jgi:hypothetical protein